MTDRARAIQAWRWMRQGSRQVQQSYIVRVPEGQLEAELERLRGERLPGLPFPNIVEVDAVPVVSGEELQRSWEALAGAVSRFAEELTGFAG